MWRGPVLPYAGCTALQGFTAPAKEGRRLAVLPLPPRLQVVLPHPKKQELDVVVFLDEQQAAPSQEEAEQRGAVAALHRVQAGFPVALAHGCVPVARVALGVCSASLAAPPLWGCAAERVLWKGCTLGGLPGNLARCELPRQPRLLTPPPFPPPFQSRSPIQGAIKSLCLTCARGTSRTTSTQGDRALDRILPRPYVQQWKDLEQQVRPACCAIFSAVPFS